jgi:uncharacterized protein (DUF849 family)
MPLLEVALNSSRNHPSVPKTPIELAQQARDSVNAGARVIHLHAYDIALHQSLATQPCADALRAVHSACPNVPVSMTTSAEIEPDPLTRFRLVKKWTLQPELVTANQGEERIVELCQYLSSRGVGIEAGLLSLSDARKFVSSGVVDKCVRVLVEPLDPDPRKAVDHAAAMEEVLKDAGISLEQVHHGDGVASWAVSEQGLQHGHGIRTGLEDTPVLPNGEIAAGNATLVREAVAMISRLSRSGKRFP